LNHQQRRSYPSTETTHLKQRSGTFKTIAKLKKGKAAGPYSIPAEASKADTETIVHNIFSKIWEKEMEGGTCHQAIKKVDLGDSSNY
jgi:hypothetical protein